MGGTGSGFTYESINSLSVDASVFFYAAGRFAGHAYFEENTYLDSQGNTDFFLAKYTPDGDLVWIKQANGTGRSEPSQIALDSNGNPYIVGFFDGSVNFDGQTITSSGGQNMFLIKYDSDSNGNLVWLHTARGSGYDEGNDMSVDMYGKVYVTGYFI